MPQPPPSFSGRRITLALSYPRAGAPPLRHLRLTCAAAIAGALLTWAVPASAEDGFVFRHERASSWQTVVIREAVAATDPTWTAVVYARRSRGIETGSLPQVASLPAGPRLTGAPHALSGFASFYVDDQMTASGEMFDKTAMTAAHKTLPLGTRVKVTNLGNGRSAIVRINDRGPFVAGRVIDVSEAAADALGMHDQGLAPVRVDLVRSQN